MSDESAQAGTDQGTQNPSIDDVFDAASEALGATDETFGESGDKPAQQQSQDGQGTQRQDGQQPPTEYQAPHHWDVQAQELFRSQPREVQEYLLNRDHAMTAAHTRRSQEIAPLRRVQEQWNEYITGLGDSPDHYFNGLAQAERTLRTGTPEQQIAVLADLAEAYGVDFSAYADDGVDGYDPAQDPLGIQAQIDAAVDPYRQQVQMMMQREQAQQAADEQAAAYAEQNAVQQMHQQLEAYRNHRDAQGNLSYPYFGEVEADMAVLAQARMDAGHTLSIPELYEQACWINPGVRAKVQAAYQHAANQQQAQANQRRSKAAGGLDGGSAGGASNGRPVPFEAAFDAAWDTIVASS